MSRMYYTKFNFHHSIIQVLIIQIFFLFEDSREI